LTQKLDELDVITHKGVELSYLFNDGFYLSSHGNTLEHIKAIEKIEKLETAET
jgi:hypothetical protein